MTKKNDKMTCSRCGKKTSIDLLKWAWVFIPSSKRDNMLDRSFNLVCPQCAQDYKAS